MTGTLPLLHVGLVDDAAHAAEVIDVRVRVDHRHDRTLAELLIDERERRPAVSFAVSASKTIQPVSPRTNVMLARSKPRTW